MADSGSITKRVYLGGLGTGFTAKDIEDRFQSFGKISNVNTVLERNFMHFDLETNETQWKRCLSAYNGTNWRGSKLRIEEAKESYLKRLERERQSPQEPPVESKDPNAKRFRPLKRHAGDMSLMTDALVDKRKGWKRGRFGRAIALMHMYKPGVGRIVIDPNHYKDNIEKLWGSVKPLPLTKLTWHYPEEKESKNNLEMDTDSSSEEPEPLRMSREEEAEDVESEHTEVYASDDGKSNLPPENQEDKILTETSTETVAVPTVIPSETMAENGGFSLSKLLGLVQEDVNPPAVSLPIVASREEAVHDAEKDMTTDTSDRHLDGKKISLSPKQLFLDISVLDGLTATDVAFCRRGGSEEARLMWKTSRPHLRSEMKDRLKQVRKRTKKTNAPNHHR